jgi:sugar-phosphatase
MTVKAVIFDMDGVIIDSEPFWRKAEIEVFNKYGIPMTEEMCRGMKGRKIDDVVRHWRTVYNWETPSNEIFEKEIIEVVIYLIKNEGVAMPYLLELLNFLKIRQIKIGLATSSLFVIMDAVIETLNIPQYFDVLHSAEAEKAGKPAPDVYLGTAKKLGVKPENCLAVEDSETGILSAQAAGMYTIAIPEAAEFHLEKYNIAQQKIKSLNDVILLDLFNE